MGVCGKQTEHQLSTNNQHHYLHQRIDNANDTTEQTLQKLFDRLDKLEQRMNKQEAHIQQIQKSTTQEPHHKPQQFETCKTDITIANQQDNFAKLNRLGETFSHLEEKLILTEEQTRSNKQKQTQRHE